MGYSLIELLMAVAVISVLTFASIEVVSDNLNETKFEQTRQQLERIKAAIIGDPAIRENNVRTSFGYVGDMGALPSSLSDLITQGTQTGFAAPTATNRIGAGWNGPYLTTAVGSVNVTTDSWGNNLVVSLGTSPATITSRGSDGATGGSGYAQDLTVSIADEEWKGTVYGYIHTDGIPISTTSTVTLYKANGSGAVGTASASVATTDKGYFSFTSVPFGKRSFTFTSGASTLGPIVFTMDRKNLELPDSVLDTNP